jgi:hypothetical protein
MISFVLGYLSGWKVCLRERGGVVGEIVERKCLLFNALLYCKNIAYSSCDSLTLLLLMMVHLKQVSKQP